MLAPVETKRPFAAGRAGAAVPGEVETLGALDALAASDGPRVDGGGRHAKTRAIVNVTPWSPSRRALSVMPATRTTARRRDAGAGRRFSFAARRSCVPLQQVQP
jgi:hypothetical protein